MMRTPILVSYVLTGLLAILSLIRGNNEFLIYAGTILVLVFIMHKTDEHFHYNKYALWGFAAWIVLHSLGGLASWPDGTRIYDWVIFNIVGGEYQILKYDQVLHFLTYVVISGLLCSVVDSITRSKANIKTVSVVVVLAAIGVGGINEIIEFMPVVLFNSPGPGGYVNTALDLIMNSLGAIFGTWLYYRKS